MSKPKVNAEEMMKNLTELKDLRDAIRLVQQSQETIEKAAPMDPNEKPRFAITDPKPKMTGGKPGGLDVLGEKKNERKFGRQVYMIGIPGHKTHYEAVYNMNAHNNPWHAVLKDSNTGDTLSHSPNMHSSSQSLASDIAHHHYHNQWKGK